MPLRPPQYWVFLGLVLALALSVAPAAATGARECLDAASQATHDIELPGDQSAARRAAAMELARLEARSALDAVATIGRPADAARALGAAARGLAPFDLKASEEAVSTAGRLLARIAEPARRKSEQRLLLVEVAILGEKALPGAPELTREEAQTAILLGLAGPHPSAALDLLQGWTVPSQLADQALPLIAVELSRTDPEKALQVAANVTSSAALERTLWRIAEHQPPFEAIAIAGRVQDPVIHSAILASASQRAVATDPESALATAREVPISPNSALAELAVALAPTDGDGAAGLARSLPATGRSWAAACIAVACADSDPERSEALLAEAGLPADAFRLALSRMAGRDPDRAIRIAQGIPGAEERESTLAAVAGVIASDRPKQAADLVWVLSSPYWRSRGAEAVARKLATSDREAALALIGLVAEPEAAQRLRADIATLIASDHPEEAERLLGSLPASYYRREKALEAARDLLLSGRKTDQIMPLARLGDKPDLSLRWLLPALAHSQQESPLHVAERIRDPYLRSLALSDTARRLLDAETRCRPAPERLAQVRPIVEWETR